MNKNEKAAIAAVIAYMEFESEAENFIKLKKNAYQSFFPGGSDIWQSSGVRNIMTGRRILDVKRKTGLN
ncbi:MAG: hypothetical protein H6681_01715 [Desulfobacteraceae bacterium]|nr:hypothetical protein [Desulfobacteraceae bacterium]MCB9494145.1 hypothetical protein [Desulfobacteraceae bacterium]